MSSLLRSWKYCKYLSGLNRAVSVRKAYPIPLQISPLINSSQNRYLAGGVAQPATKNPLDRHIRKLDAEVRRSGRVNLKDLQEIYSEIKLSQHATSYQCLMLIRCCGNLLPDELPQVRLQLVSDIWATLEKQGVPMDVSHYNALLMVYLEDEHKFSPTEFLSKLSKKAIEPNRVTFQRLIAAFCHQGNIDGATRILEFMKEKQMPISENIFNSLITGHSVANDMESAVGILGVMEQAGVSASSDTYTALLCGYARHGDMTGLSETLAAAESKQIQLSDRQLLEVIYNLSVSGHPGIVDMIISRLSRGVGYNQDAKNTILRLVGQGCDESAIKVLKTMTPIVSNSEEEPLPQATFLLKQMVKMNRPYETLMQVCEDLKNSKVNERALYYATESCLIHDKTEVGLQLIAALAKDDQVCQHYYWPAICQYGRDGNQQGIIKTLKQMSIDMNQPVPNETLREYVVEHIGANERGIMALRQAGVTVASAASAVVAHHLASLDLASAARIASKYRANYNIAAVRRGIVQAFKIKPDVDNLLVILRSMITNMSNAEEEGESTEDPAGSVLLGIAASLRQPSEQLTHILKGYLEFGMALSKQTAESLQELLSGNQLTPEINNLLTQLTSPNITFVPLERSTPTKSITFQKDEAYLKEAIASAEAKQESSDLFRFQLMSLYCKQQEYAQAQQVKQELDSKGVELPGEYLLQLLNTCVLNENLSESEKYYTEITRRQDKISISDTTLVKLAALYISADRFDDAIKLFESHKADSYTEKEFSYSSSCWKLLNALAEKGDSAKLDQLFNTMRQCNFITPTNVLLGPLIKVHIVNNDLMKALDKFEECCTVYRATPWKNEIACKLIQCEDAASLQRLTDLSSQIHGEVNSLYDLVLSFIECGRVRQARKILETPGLRTRHSRLSSACLRYQNEGHVAHLENLVEVTKDLPHIDRADIYYHLLGSYCRGDEVDKALGLWTQMQEEDVTPTDRFLYRLAGLLRKHNRSVPFAVPTSTTSNRMYTLQKDSQETEQLKDFRRAVYAKDADKALEIKNSLQDGELQSSDRSALLTLLINSGRLGESSKLVIRWLELGLRPNIRTLSYLINTVAKTGDVTTLTNIGNMLDEDLKKMTSFTNRYVHCMVEAGKSDAVFQLLDKEISSATTPQQLEECCKTFPRGGAFSLLYADQLNLPKFEELAAKYQEKGLLEPLNILWIYHFLNKNTEKADKIWTDIKSVERLMYQPILKKARAERDLQMAEDLLAKCKETSINKGALGAVHSCILDILVMQDRMEDSCTRLDQTLETIPIENISYQTLRKIKSNLEKEGKLFKYSLPARRRRPMTDGSSSDSDSDSDREVRQKA